MWKEARAGIFGTLHILVNDQIVRYDIWKVGSYPI